MIGIEIQESGMDILECEVGLGLKVVDNVVHGHWQGNKQESGLRMVRLGEGKETFAEFVPRAGCPFSKPGPIVVEVGEMVMH